MWLRKRSACALLALALAAALSHASVGAQPAGGAASASDEGENAHDMQQAGVAGAPAPVSAPALQPSPAGEALVAGTNSADVDSAANASAAAGPAPGKHYAVLCAANATRVAVRRLARLVRGRSALVLEVQASPAEAGAPWQCLMMAVPADGATAAALVEVLRADAAVNALQHVPSSRAAPTIVTDPARDDNADHRVSLTVWSAASYAAFLRTVRSKVAPRNGRNSNAYLLQLQLTSAGLPGVASSPRGATFYAYAQPTQGCTDNLNSNLYIIGYTCNDCGGVSYWFGGLDPLDREYSLGMGTRWTPSPEEAPTRLTDESTPTAVYINPDGTTKRWWGKRGAPGPNTPVPITGETLRDALARFATPPTPPVFRLAALEVIITVVIEAARFRTIEQMVSKTLFTRAERKTYVLRRDTCVVLEPGVQVTMATVRVRWGAAMRWCCDAQRPAGVRIDSIVDLPPQCLQSFFVLQRRDDLTQDCVPLKVAVARPG